MRFSSRARVCSSIIGAILIALPSTWGVKRKSLTRTPFEASACTGRTEEIPARLRGETTLTCRPSSRHRRWIFSLTSRRSS
ncbi:MAG: hypothetical protein K2X56_06150 [Mycobacterium pseudokansasii]|uniref:hypothetical protein n=1 Tax=Mycobacterium pseudokansasii TaxID=2341080 RepID=UPI0007B4F9AB|nr:hypothetical protein [Mycobacterium pseudokansasii]KZS65109.1 hypothetical protein A4G27_26995 [Mycobacterium kansasii]MBY0387680.1 hypothetical protein [Mycobacterium pseudokansasii]